MEKEKKLALLKKFTREEKLKLVKEYFDGDMMLVRAIVDTLDDVQIDKWVENNVEELIVNGKK